MLNKIIFAILLAIFCFFVALLAHLALFYFRKGRQGDEPVIFELGRQARLLFFIWFGLFIIYVYLFFFPPAIIIDLVNRLDTYLVQLNFICGIAFYLFFFFVYLSFYYLIERSVSATILEIVEYSPQKKLTLYEIKKIYDVEKKYESELKGMLEGSFIVKEGDYYRNNFKGRIFAKVAKFFKRYLKLGPGG